MRDIGDIGDMGDQGGFDGFCWRGQPLLGSEGSTGLLKGGSVKALSRHIGQTWDLRLSQQNSKETGLYGAQTKIGADVTRTCNKLKG